MHAVANWSGDEWEQRCIFLLRRRYGADQVQVIPVISRGDLGIEAFTCDGFVFRCYAPHEPMTVRERYEKQRAKLSTGLIKLMDHQDEFSRLLGNVKITRYVLMVPHRPSLELVQHASAKEAEYRALNLPFLGSDFRIDIVNDEASLPDRIRPVDLGTPESGEIPSVGHGSCAVIRSRARGDRSDYRCARFPILDSGQADVFEAVHKDTKIAVALKKLRQKYPSERQVARMRREIEIGLALDGHPNAVPILDHGTDCKWFVMPLADKTAEACQAVLQNDSDELRALVDALASVLSVAHEEGWLHRDIKPSNILHLDNRWTLADWGIVRRPRGATTKVGRTGTSIGTLGFSAPELSVNPHEATFASDIYSIGRVIAWALTGQEPLANLPLLPSSPGPWRNIVRRATNQDPALRPQSILELMSLIEEELAEEPVDPITRAAALIETANKGETGAASALLALLTDHTGDYSLYVEELIRLRVSQAGRILARDSAQAHVIFRALAGHVDGDDTRRVEFGEAATVVTWLCDVASYAANRHHWDVLEDAVDAMCIWDAAWDQWSAQKRVRSWLESLSGEAAAAVASVLRQHEESAHHFSGLAGSRGADLRIRQAVRSEST